MRNTPKLRTTYTTYEGGRGNEGGGVRNGGGREGVSEGKGGYHLFCSNAQS